MLCIAAMKSQKAASDTSEQSEGTDEKETLTDEEKKGVKSCMLSITHTHICTLLFYTLLLLSTVNHLSSG